MFLKRPTIHSADKSSCSQSRALVILFSAPSAPRDREALLTLSHTSLACPTERLTWVSVAPHPRLSCHALEFVPTQLFSFPFLSQVFFCFIALIVQLATSDCKPDSLVL